MNLFKKDTLTPATPSRTPIADIPVQLFSVYERLYNRNRRLYGLAQVLGGDYPVPTNPSTEAPIDICGRIHYDMQNVLQQLDEMDAHLVRLERLCGIETDSPMPGGEQEALQQKLDDALEREPFYPEPSPSLS